MNIFMYILHTFLFYFSPHSYWGTLFWLQSKLTLAVGSIIWDEDGHVVCGAESFQAGAVVAAIRVVAPLVDRTKRGILRTLVDVCK